MKQKIVVPIDNVLNRIILIMSVLAGLGLMAVPFIYLKKTGSFVVISALLISMILAKFLMWRGWVRPAGVFTVASAWMIFACVILFGGGLNNINVVFFISLAVIAGLLWGERATRLAAAAGIAMSAVLASLDLLGYLPSRYFLNTPLGNLAQLVLAMILTASALNIALRDRNKALEMANNQLEDRLAAEEALRESEGKYRVLTEGMKDVVWILDVETQRFLYASPSVQNLTGYSSEDVTAQTLDAFLMPGASEGFKSRLRLRAAEFLSGRPASDQFFTHEMEQPCKDGSTVWTEIIMSFYWNEKTGRLELHGVTRDISERKRGEEERALLNAILENTSDLVATSMPDGRLIYMNDAGRRMLGWDEDKNIHAHAISDAHFPWALRIVREEGIPAALQHGVWQGETAVRRKDGKEIPVSQVIVAHRLADGKVGHISTIMRDLSEIKQAEEDMRAWMRRYDLIVEASGQVAYEYCAPSGAITWGRSLEKVLGYSLEKMQGGFAQWEELLHPDDRSKTLSLLERAEKTCAYWDTEYRMRHKLGHDVWIRDRGFFLPDSEGKASTQLGMLEDVTERKRAEETIRENEEKFRMIFDLAPIPLVISDLDGRYIDVNEHTCKRLNLGREQIIGRNRGDFAESGRVEDPREEARLQEKFLKQGFLRNEEIKMIRPSTQERFTVISSSQLITLAGKPCVISMVLDITEKKRMEEQLIQSQKMESIGRLAGGVAHDFNNMLGVILGHTEIALEKVEPTLPLYTNLQQILKAAERSAHLTQQLLAFARKQTVNPRVLDLNETIDGMLKLLRRLIGEDIDLAWHPGSGLWAVKVDPSQIDQILANLCVNARDAIAGVGKVIIETMKITFDETNGAEHAGVVAGDFVMIAVSDNGKGMDKETQRRLFEPFFTTKEPGKGTGLGLATVYGIVKQNNGFINVYSEPERGTTFRIYLPRHQGQDDHARSAENKRPLIKGHETVLLVEDESALLNLTQAMLEKLGYRVLSAGAPSEAIRLAGESAGNIQLLLTDVVMPEMNGRQLVENLKIAFPDLKCLYTSGYTADIIAHHGVLDEGVCFIQKPFSIYELAAKVREALEQK